MNRPTERAGAALAVGLVAALTGPATASEWPMFRGNPAQSGVSPGPLPRDLAPRWTFQAEEGFESTAAIVDGTAFVGSLDGRLYAVDAKTGTLRWKYETGQEIKSSPTVHGGAVYFGDESGTFHAVDASTGARRWTFKTDAGITSSANVAGDRLVFGSYDNFLYCVKASDGSLVWKVETDGYVHGTPAVLELDGETLVASSGCDGFLRLVKMSDGTVIGKVELGGYVGASPATDRGRAYIGTFENQVLGIDLRERKILWTFEDPERHFPFYASAAIDRERVVVAGRDREVRALRPADGTLVWKFAAASRVDASPVIVGDRVFVATTGGELIALDLETGKPGYRFDSGSSFSASPSVSDGVLVLGDLDGLLYGFGGKEGSSR